MAKLNKKRSKQVSTKPFEAKSDRMLRSSMEDDTFMAECWKRTYASKDNSKCDTCHLRFRCYTEEWGKVVGYFGNQQIECPKAGIISDRIITCEEIDCPYITNCSIREKLPEFITADGPAFPVNCAHFERGGCIDYVKV